MLGYYEIEDKLEELKQLREKAETSKFYEPYLAEYIEHIKRLEAAYQKERVKALARLVDKPQPKPDRDAIKWNHYFR